MTLARINIPCEHELKSLLRLKLAHYQLSQNLLSEFHHFRPKYHSQHFLRGEENIDVFDWFYRQLELG